jgi:hypothetical protein
MTHDAPSRISQPMIIIINDFPFSFRLGSAPEAAIINHPTKIPKNQIIYIAVITNLIIPPISFGKTFATVLFVESGLAGSAEVVFLMHLPTKGMFIFSIICVAGSHFSPSAVCQF